MLPLNGTILLLFDYYPQQVDAELGDFCIMGISIVWKGMRELDAHW